MSKKKSELEAELKELKERVRSLTKAQLKSVKEVTPERAREVAMHAKDALVPDFEELLELLKHEVEDLDPMTCLAIFGLGVLTGRLLAH